jgi:hypothetical protein
LQIPHNLPADGPHVRPETPNVQREVPNNPGEVDNFMQEPGNVCREIFDNNPLRGSEKRVKYFPQKGFRCRSYRTGLFLAAGEEKKPGRNSMKLLTSNACRLLAGGREFALVNLLTSTGADVTTITECEIPEGSGEFRVAGYTMFAPTLSLQGGKT